MKNLFSIGEMSKLQIYLVKLRFFMIKSVFFVLHIRILTMAIVITVPVNSTI